jgi:hypothetical protein
MPVGPRERPTEHLDRPTVGSEEAGQQAHRRGLAGTVRPEEAVDDPGRDRKVESIERASRAVALAEGTGSEGKVSSQREKASG